MEFYLVVSSPAGQAHNFSVKLQKEITLDEGWKVAALQVDFPTDQKKRNSTNICITSNVCLFTQVLQRQVQLLKYSNIKNINDCIQYMAVRQSVYTDISFLLTYLDGTSYTDLELPLTILIHFKHSLY